MQCAISLGINQFESSELILKISLLEHVVHFGRTYLRQRK